MERIEAYPLYWPSGWPRSETRVFGYMQPVVANARQIAAAIAKATGEECD